MKIVDVAVYPLVTVLRQYPTVISMQATPDGVTPVEESYFVLFEIIADNGLRGIGEVSDIPPDALPDLPAFRDQLRSVVASRNPFDVIAILKQAGFEARENRTLGTRLYDGALDMALHDLQGKHVGEPVYRLLGGARHDRIPISAVLYIRDSKRMAEEVRVRCDQGFRHFKLKVGLNIDQDEESLAVVREVAGAHATIKIDPNGAWSVDEAINFLRRLERFGIAGVETPIPARDIAGKVALKRETPVPIFEHVSDPEFALECAATGAVDIFNVALCGTGGIDRARRVAAVAEASGIPCLVGSTLELWPGTAAQAHFGASLDAHPVASDLVGPLMYRSDVAREPWTYRRGSLRVPERPGLGVELDYGRLGAPI